MRKTLFWIALAAVLGIAALAPARAASPVTGSVTIEFSQQGLFVPAIGENVDISGDIAIHAAAIQRDSDGKTMVFHTIDLSGLQVVGEKSGDVLITRKVLVGVDELGPEGDISIAEPVLFLGRPPGQRQHGHLVLFFEGKLQVSGSQTLALKLQSSFNLAE